LIKNKINKLSKTRDIEENNKKSQDKKKGKNKNKNIDKNKK
jgi:hypothetical protein